MRTSLCALLSMLLAFHLVAGFSGLPAFADAASSMVDPIYQRVNPTTGVTLTTPWEDEASNASLSYGYSTDLGIAFTASRTSADGLTAVHRLWNDTSVDFIEALEGSETFVAAQNAGYSDDGVTFYALANAVEGRTEPIHSYVKSGKHRLATQSSGTSLVNSGWKLDGVAFHVLTISQTPERSNPEDSGVDAGSIAVGAASYQIPSSAIHVSTAGNDNSPGTDSSPVRTIQKGVEIAPTGGTVVVRAGVYRESIVIGKTVTVQNYPNEAVWLDGSKPVAGWTAKDGIWRSGNWDTRFDSSPTYTQGAAENTEPDWRFVNADYPMAAHPDQVFINGSPLQQVKSRSLVQSGTFYVDERTSKLFIGSNPTGQKVEASTIVKALSVRGANSIIRGVGIRRYSPSVFHMGSVTIERPGVTLENVVIENAATTGLSVLRDNVRLNQVTVTGSGMLGIHARFADDLQLSRALSTKNNTEHFNTAPVSGGLKLHQSRGINVLNSRFSGNYGHGFWEDMSVYDTVIRQSDFSENSGTGLFLEISAKAIIGDNTFVGNGEFGIKVNNTSDVKIWNNTFSGGRRPINLVQDTRRNTNKSDPAVDPRMAFPDPAMPWTLGPVALHNNVITSGGGSSDCLLCVEDYSHSRSAEQMSVSADGNVYGRTSATQPTWVTVWSRGDTNPDPFVFATLDEFRATTGQESRGREWNGDSILDQNLTLTHPVSSQSDIIAEALPEDVAFAIGRKAGTRQLGHW